MKRINILFVAITLVISAYAQKPEKIYSFAKVDKPHEYYVEQAGLWWKIIEKDLTNEDAWYNYYRANRNCLGTYKFIGVTKKDNGWLAESPYLKELDTIVKLIGENIPNTFTYYRLQWMGYPNNDDKLKMLEKANAMEPDNAEIYDDLVTSYEMKGNHVKRKEFNKKMYKANEISEGFIAYNYNVMISMKPNSIILTYGDNDTYPLWLLQDALGIREDITVFNLPLLADDGYRNLMFNKTGYPEFNKKYKDGWTENSVNELTDFIINNKPAASTIYIGLPAWKDLKEYENNLYLSGLVMEYSNENIDNIAVLKNNFENKYALDYISNNFSYDISREIVERMNVNYLPGIIKLYQHYILSGEKEKAGKMKQLGLTIACKGGDEWKAKAEEILK